MAETLDGRMEPGLDGAAADDDRRAVEAGRIHARSPRRPSVWIWRAALAVLIVLFVKSLFTTQGYQWGVVRHYLTAPAILEGLVRTLWLTVFSMGIGITLGIILAVMRLSSDRVVSGVSATYTTVFRGTPLLVQLFFWYNIAALYPRISLGIPFGPSLISANANTLVTPAFAAILALGLNEAAYMAEIIRAGIQSVDRGQIEAAHALGMSSRLTLRRVILPQATRLVLPPTGNQTIGMLKVTSVVVVVGMSDLLYSAQTIYTRTYQVIPLLIVASIWYFVVTSVLAVGQAFLEAHLRSSGSRRTGQSSGGGVFRALRPGRGQRLSDNAVIGDVGRFS
jgi:polar amino acid transport system permease protein